jgi:hypothetical protein
LAGHLAVVFDLISHLPAKIWYAEPATVNDKAFLPQILAWLPSNSLLVFDLGYFAFPFFDALTAADSWFVSRLRQKASYVVEKVLLDRPQVHDRIVHLGQYRSSPAQHSVRLIDVFVDGAWRQYLTNDKPSVLTRVSLAIDPDLTNLSTA